MSDVPAVDVSVAVLPFANLSSDPENEYFSDGLTEELIADLSTVKALRVISRASALRFKGSAATPREIGDALGVHYILEGSVRKAGANLRITARMIDAWTDRQLWAGKYAGTMEDVFNLQERVSKEIVQALNVTLTADEARQLAERPIDDPRVLDCLLRARHELWTGNADRAERLLRQGIEAMGPVPALVAGLGLVEITGLRLTGNPELRGGRRSRLGNDAARTRVRLRVPSARLHREAQPVHGSPRAARTGRPPAVGRVRALTACQPARPLTLRCVCPDG